MHLTVVVFLLLTCQTVHPLMCLQVDDLDNKVKGVEKKITDIGAQVSSVNQNMEQKFENLEQKFENLDQRIEKGNADSKASIQNMFEGMKQYLDSLMKDRPIRAGGGKKQIFIYTYSFVIITHSCLSSLSLLL